jgi:hypothetical protein
MPASPKLMIMTMRNKKTGDVINPPNISPYGRKYKRNIQMDLNTISEFP